MLKRRTLLNEVVTDQVKTAILRENGGFIMDGAVLEVEHQLGGHAIATGDLNDVALSESVALQRMQYQETMECSLRVAKSHRLRRRSGWLDKCGAGNQNREGGGQTHKPSCIKTRDLDWSILNRFVLLCAAIRAGQSQWPCGKLLYGERACLARGQHFC